MNNINDIDDVTSFHSPKRYNSKTEENERTTVATPFVKRQEPYQESKEQFIPKAVALACSLLPQVKQEFRNKEQHQPQAKEENDANILKTTGLDDELENGLYGEDWKTSSPNDSTIDYVSECRHLPPSAAKALTSLLRSSRTMRYEHDRDDEFIKFSADRDEDDDDSVLFRSKELFGLKSDLDLRDKEGDAILDSIRNDSLTPPSECIPFWANNDEDSNCHDLNWSERSNSNQEQKNDPDVNLVDGGEDEFSLATVDDDDLHGELNRLGTVISSLRSDLSVIETSHRSLGGNGLAERRRDFISNNTIELANRLTTLRGLGKALSPQDYPEAQDGRRIFDRASSLYWAIAFVWAIAILLAGHVKFSGDMRIFSGFLDFLLKL